MLRPRRLLPGLIACLLMSACAPDGPRPLALTLRDVPSLSPVLGHYALWARTDAQDLLAGAFRVAPGGRLLTLGGEAPASLAVPAGAGEVREFFLTQERPDASHERPSKQVFLRGAVRQGAGELSLEPPIRAADFARASGRYLLDNPVTYRDPADMNGLWFAVIRSRRYEPGLVLPPAPPGWLYAGWVVVGGVPLRTGKFRAGDDNDDWAGYSGRSGATELINPAGKPMPGEDFITALPAGVPRGPNLPRLGGARVIVSLENATLVNEDAYPSPLRILEATIPAAPVHKLDYPLENVVKALPGATLRLE